MVFMPQSYVEPDARLSRFTCPRCHALAGQEWRPLHYFKGSSSQRLRDVDIDEDDYGPGPFDDDNGMEWDATLCHACGKHSFWHGEMLVFPNVSGASNLPTASPDMPKEVAELYNEAIEVLPISRRASAALCRAALERLAKLLTTDLDPRQNLDSRLAHLTSEVSSSAIQILQAIRHVGNKSLHGQADNDECVALYLDNSESEIARLFFEAINSLVDELISRPRQAKEVFGLLPLNIQQDIHAKAQRTSQAPPGEHSNEDLKVGDVHHELPEV